MLRTNIQRILEAFIDDDYNRNFSSIPRETFDLIVMADPKSKVTDGKPQGIGFGAKSLLLPKYLNGETDFIDNLEEITSALKTYYENQKSYPDRYRNIGNFPSVEDFLNLVEDPTRMNSSSNDEKEINLNPIDIIYNKYFSEIERDIFDKIIKCDPETTNRKIGTVAKNLLLPKYKSGETSFVNDLDEVTDAIYFFYDNKDSFPTEKQKIESFESVNDFIDYITRGPDSDFLIRLRNSPDVKENVDWKLVTSTLDYDVITPLTHKGNAAITHDVQPISSATRYLKWCTGWENDTYWRRYEQYYLFCFINKKEPRKQTVNYQLAVKKNSDFAYFLDGTDDAQNREQLTIFKEFLLNNPDVTKAISKVPILETNPQVVEVKARFIYSNKPFVVKSQEDILDYQTEAFEVVRKLIIENITEIPSGAFFGSLVLREVEFKAPIKVIGPQAFMSCGKLNNLQLPKTLESIGAEAFADCTSLTNSIRVPDSLTEIGREAFRGTHCTLSIDRNRTNKLIIDSYDRDWFIAHHKAIKVQENLDEDYLNENIPRDLVKAYQTAERAERGIQNHTQSRHAEVGSNVRRGVNYDYANSTYEVITPQQAKDLIKNNRNEIENLRIIIDGQLIEYEIRSGNRFYQTYYISHLPMNRFGDHPILDKYGNPTSDSRYAVRLGDVYNLFDVADKIYKTDEYEHPIETAKTKTSVRVGDKRDPETGEVLTDSEGNPLYDYDKLSVTDRRLRNSRTRELRTMTPNTANDYLPHNQGRMYGYGDRTHIVQNVLDTGSHSLEKLFSFGPHGSDRKYSRDYISAVKKARELFRDYDYARKALKKHRAERNLYDSEDDYSDIEANLQTHQYEAYYAYIEAKRKVTDAKDKLIMNVEDYTLDIHDRLKSILDVIEGKLNRLYQVNNTLATERNKKLSEFSPEAKAIERSINSQKENIKAQRREVQEINNQIAERERQIEELKLKRRNSNTNIESYLTELVKLQNNLTETAQTALKEKFKQVDELEQEARELEAKLDELLPKKAQIKNIERARSKKTDVQEPLKDVISFESTEEEEVDSTTTNNETDSTGEE